VQGEQPRLAEQPGDGREVLIPPDEAGHRHRQRQRRRLVHGPSAGIRYRHRVAQDVLLDALQGR